MFPTENSSLAELLRSLPESERIEALAGIPEEQCARWLYDWRGFWARPNQILPGTPGAANSRADWLFWILKAGRGFGKTRVGAETVREWGEDPNARILMIAPTTADVREVMIEGESGLMQCYPPDRRPIYNSSRHLVLFPSGAIGITRSADEPERLRGPQFNKFWADEFCAWNYPQEAWEQLSFGFRVRSAKLQGVITTTPKPIKIFRELLAGEDTVITGGSSYENRSNLADAYFNRVIRPYEGTRLGRQEINAEVLDDFPGALWSRRVIDENRVQFKEVVWEALARIVVAIDPAVTAGEDSDETGIVVAGLTRTGHVIVIDDLTCRESPLGWAAIAIKAYKQYRADRIVGEVNNGGDLVGANIWGVDRSIPFRAVRASRGKAVRAEPVAALYEQKRVHHIRYPEREDRFAALEDQLCSFVPGIEQKSPDRMDALVWAITELVIDQEEITVTMLREIEEISPV
jgi:phage terminase large subunit-like protein